MIQTKSDIAKTRLAGIGILVACSLLFAGTASSMDKYQFQVLFEPTPDNLEAEARGRIMIYDGMKYATVNRAMDEQFERIENMMFVRTVYQQEDGELEVEEDGCD